MKKEGYRKNRKQTYHVSAMSSQMIMSRKMRGIEPRVCRDTQMIGFGEVTDRMKDPIEDARNLIYKAKGRGMEVTLANVVSLGH